MDTYWPLGWNLAVRTWAGVIANVHSGRPDIVHTANRTKMDDVATLAHNNVDDKSSCTFRGGQTWYRFSATSKRSSLRQRISCEMYWATLIILRITIPMLINYLHSPKDTNAYAKPLVNLNRSNLLNLEGLLRKRSKRSGHAKEERLLQSGGGCQSGSLGR